MRNIALLEWGPASLYYILPRERLKVRTDWLEGGPPMPPFLSTLEDAKASATDAQDLCVRYALSAFEDLNGAIRNLRRCFGFPYQEYIGYLNTLTRKHRARREHEALLPGLRRWAIFGNVDAVVWIDYAKSNQPPGSFKMGPRDSRPFSSNHMELCAHMVGGEGHAENNKDDDSEVAWSDADPEEQAHVQHGAAGASPGGHPDLGSSTGMKLGPGAEHHNESSRRPSKTEGGLISMGLRPMRKGKKGPGGPRAAKAGAPTGKVVARTPQDRQMYESALQEEYVPAHGSIYVRSIAPGPGYYSTGPVQASAEAAGPSFGKKFKTPLEIKMKSLGDTPGPCEYEAQPKPIGEDCRFGQFCRAQKLVGIAEAPRKLPFISEQTAILGMATPNVFSCVCPEAADKVHGHERPPTFSFGRLRRPF